MAGNYTQAIREYIKLAQQEPALLSCFAGNIRLCQQRLNAATTDDAKTAVVAWDLTHNAVGRALALYGLYHYCDLKSDLIGCNFWHDKQPVWPPLADSDIPYLSFTPHDRSQLFDYCIDFVLQHPYSRVHLAKPRLVNMLLGFLYKLIWGAVVVMDIDDEELAIVEKTEPVMPQHFLTMPTSKLNSIGMTSPFWTQLTVGAAALFDGVTVSNPALQKRYGGSVLPHVRDERNFIPTLLKKSEYRARFGIPQDAKVLLFLGTPRKHKGLIETARLIAGIADPLLLFVIVGDFSDDTLKQELLSIANVNYRFIPAQPYSELSNVVAIGDCCVLLQDGSKQLAEYQLPAKLVDALAMGLTVFVTRTPAIEHLIDGRSVIAVNESNLVAELVRFLSKNDVQQVNEQSRSLFLKQLSCQASAPVLNSTLKLATAKQGELMVEPTLHAVFDGSADTAPMVRFLKVCFEQLQRD